MKIPGSRRFDADYRFFSFGRVKYFSQRLLCGLAGNGPSPRLMVAQLVIDIAGDLSARRGDRFEDYTEAIRNLARDARFPADLVRELERIPGFRNVVMTLTAPHSLENDRTVFHTAYPQLSISGDIHSGTLCGAG